MKQKLEKETLFNIEWKEDRELISSAAQTFWIFVEKWNFRFSTWITTSSHIVSSSFAKAVELIHHILLHKSLFRLIFDQCKFYITRVCILHKILPTSHRNDSLSVLFCESKSTINSQWKDFKNENEQNHVSSSWISSIPINSEEVTSCRNNRTIQQRFLQSEQQNILRQKKSFKTFFSW